MEPRTPIERAVDSVQTLAGQSQETTSFKAPTATFTKKKNLSHKVAELLADNLFSGFKVTRDNRITVILSGGYGDLIFALRTAQLLQMHFPQAEITLVASQEGKRKIEQIQADLSFGVSVLDVHAYNEQLHSGGKKPHLIVEAPVFNMLTQNLHWLDEDTEILLISKYGANADLHRSSYSADEQKSILVEQYDLNAHRIHTLRTGLSSDEEGIFIDQALTEETDRKALWASLSPELSKALLQSSSAKKYDSERDLAVSYSSFYTEQALCAHGEFVKNNNKHADMLFLGRGSEGCLNLSETTKASLLVNGFNTIICQPLGDPLGTRYLDLTSGQMSQEKPSAAGRTYRIIYSGSEKMISHAELMKVNKLAGPFRATTASESQAEAYSDPDASILFYKAMAHQTAFVREMRAMASTYESQAKGITRAAQLLTYGIEREEIHTLFSAEMMKALGALIRDPAIQQAFAEMHKTIRSEHDVSLRMVARVNRILLMNEYPHLFEEDYYFREACRSQHDVDEAANLLFASLRDRKAIADTYVPENLRPKYNHLSDAILHNDYEQVLLELKLLQEEALKSGVNSLIHREDHVFCNETMRDGKNVAYEPEDHMRLPANLAVTVRENIRILKALLRAGLDVNDADHKGYAPLHVAIMKGEKEIMTFLLEQGADVNKQMDNGQTPLHLAVLAKDFSLIQLLVERGASLTTVDREGKKPIDLCEDETIKSFLQKKLQDDQLIATRKKLYSSLGVGSTALVSEHGVYGRKMKGVVTPLPSPAKNTQEGDEEVSKEQPVRQLITVKI